MRISSDLFNAFLKCPTKCWLRAAGEPASGNAYAEWVTSQNGSYRATELDRLLSEIPKGAVVVSPPPENLMGTRWRLAANLAVHARMNTYVLDSELHAVERALSEGRGRPQLIPIRFVFRNKLGEDDKLLLAFDAFGLSKVTECETGLGKIIHGDDHRTLKVKTALLYGEVQKRIERAAALLSSRTPPDLALNRHCGECEFQIRCRQKAIEADDLNLLSGMSVKERKKLRSNGIFTITQLSYTFRPRRRPKRMRDKQERYHHSLKALAIREKKIHIVGRPELNIEGTPIYLDVEGLPDHDTYYLIGVRIGGGDSAVHHSLWADTAADEGKIWREFLGILETVEKPLLIHYGNYETAFLNRMGERHGKPPEGSAAAETVKAAVNLLSVIFAHVYFPTFSNGLKEIAEYLGFRRSDPALTGVETIKLRHEWAASRARDQKSSLLTYNSEDCKALDVVTSKVVELTKAFPNAGSLLPNEVVDTTTLKREHPYGFKRNRFAFPELDVINKAAYWDYQRELIYVKSHPNLKRTSILGERPRQVIAPNKIIECMRPRSCPKCASTKFFKHTKYSKTIFDLKFMGHGIKRWVTRYRFHRYHCQGCGTVFQPEETCWGKCKFGSEIRAYSLYPNIELRLPQLHVASMLNRLFGFNLDSSTVGAFKADAAENYKGTFNALVNRLCSGRLLHVDETKVNLRDKDGFVWVFANMEDVAYVYSDTRDGDLVQTMLKDFAGVLVSDFYTAYDSIQCPQQKCLIHLIRDLNDDVLRHPYDDDLKQIALSFAFLLKPMIATIDRYGLKRRFLKKYLVSVERFYRQISESKLQSDTAVKVKDRLEKNRDKLFTFLSYDGVPWNNNNAEHAVKPFAELRQTIGGVTTEKGLRDYLVLLSLCQTCRYIGLDFLDFLCSGEKDLHAFADSRRRKGKPCVAPTVSTRHRIVSPSRDSTISGFNN
jgi:predicted RecB family nuclease